MGVHDALGLSGRAACIDQIREVLGRRPHGRLGVGCGGERGLVTLRAGIGPKTHEQAQARYLGSHGLGGLGKIRLVEERRRLRVQANVGDLGDAQAMIDIDGDKARDLARAERLQNLAAVSRQHGDALLRPDTAI